MERINPIEKYSYLIGQQINRWTVLDIKNDRRHADAICRCECGTIKPVNIRNLLSNSSKDCGCGRKQRLSETKSKNLVGKRFGKLLVEEMMPTSNRFKRRLYRCKCDCGNVVVLPSSSLTTNHTLSCGCLNSYYNLFIHFFLEKLCIKHIQEYPVVINRVRYRFDFYLPDYNLFIEYDGQQHYQPMRYHGDNLEKNYSDFLRIKERDNIKNKYCFDNNIDLLRIPFYESKNIEEIISNHLQRLNEKGLIGYN